MSIYDNQFNLNKFQRERLYCAFHYAEKGYPVLLLKGKVPISRNGVKDATTDEQEIVEQFLENPNSNIGIRLGQESKTWVLDIDIKDGKDGLKSLDQHFSKKIDINTNYMIQKTPTGGLHLFFECPDDLHIPNSVGVLEGIDIRGDNGYVVVCPSALKVDDKWIKYDWLDPEEIQPAPVTEWANEILKLARDKKKTPVDVKSLLLNGVSEGQRDTSIFKFTCLLKKNGIDPCTATSILNIVADRCNPPFSQSEVIKKVDYVYGNELVDSLEMFRDGGAS